MAPMQMSLGNFRESIRVSMDGLSPAERPPAGYPSMEDLSSIFISLLCTRLFFFFMLHSITEKVKLCMKLLPVPAGKSPVRLYDSRVRLVYTMTALIKGVFSGGISVMLQAARYRFSAASAFPSSLAWSIASASPSRT